MPATHPPAEHRSRQHSQGAAFAAAFARLIAVEGGYVNDSADSGGRTNWGITEAVARAYGYNGEMSELPRSLAAGIG